MSLFEGSPGSLHHTGDELAAGRHTRHDMHEVTDGTEDGGEIEMGYGYVKHLSTFPTTCGQVTAGVMMPLQLLWNRFPDAT